MEVILVKEPQAISFTGNPMPYSLSVYPYGAKEKGQDIRLIIKVLVELVFNSNIFTEVKAQQFFPDDNGMIGFDVKTIIDPYLEYYTPRPTLTRPVQALQQRKRYKLQYLLQKDGVVIGGVQDTPVLFALKGGLAYDQWHPTAFFNEHVLANKKPLHFITEEEKCFASDVKYLYWLYPYADNAPQTVFIDVELDDLTVLAYTHPKTIFGGQWSVLCAPICIEKLGIALPVGTRAKSITVKVMAGATVIVAPITYQLRQQNIYKGYTLMYRNSLGAMETVTLRGQVEFEADYSRQQASRTMAPNSFSNAILQAQTIDAAGTEVLKFKGDTGFLTTAAADKLRDLFLSQDKFEHAGGKIYPISINAKNTKFFTNKEQLISLQIDWQRAYVNEYYTPANFLNAAAACPAMEKLAAKQINKRLLQIMYACQSPYDMVQVEIITSGGTEAFTYLGNSRTVRQPFTNPLVAGTENITVRCRTVCDPDADPQDVGPWTVVNLDITANTLPIAQDDYFTIAVGYNAPVTLTGNVLANDSDPDGDAIAVIAVVNQPTNAGGTISIAANGVVTYQPPTSVYTGQDYYDYQIRETPSGTPVTARAFINVGTSGGLIYGKKVERNVQTTYSGYIQNVTGEIWVEFYSNAAGTVPVDVSSLGFTVEVVELVHYEPGGGAGNVTNNIIKSGAGTAVQFYEGTLSYEELNPAGGAPLAYEAHFFTLQNSPAYIII